MVRARSIVISTAHPIPEGFDLNFVRANGEAVREAVEAAGASNPRVIGEVARGLTPRDNHLDVLVSSQPRLSLFGLVELEQRLGLILDMDVGVWTEEGYRPDELARYLADALPL